LNLCFGSIVATDRTKLEPKKTEEEARF